MNELIYTSKGNLPIDSLKYETLWDVQETYIKFTERYTDQTGEIVRESAHVYDKQGVTAKVEAGSF
jgi:hypothetical protein